LCVICGKIEINDFWYRPLKVPPHDPSYRGAICPECRKKREMKKKSEEKPGDTITAS
jgi:DNA-directed RNA polymerase subunit RPC12/RpoP